MQESKKAIKSALIEFPWLKEYLDGFIEQAIEEIQDEQDSSIDHLCLAC